MRVRHDVTLGPALAALTGPGMVCRRADEEQYMNGYPSEPHNKKGNERRKCSRRCESSFRDLRKKGARRAESVGAAWHLIISIGRGTLVPVVQVTHTSCIYT